VYISWLFHVATGTVVTYIFYRAATTTPAGTVPFVDITDPAEQQRIFRDGGRPWVVQCLVPGAPDVTPGVAAAAARNPRGLRFAAVDCGARLPSGKTVFQRFHVSKDMRPAPVFLAHAGLPVVQPPWDVAKDGKRLAQWAIDTSEPKVIRISDEADIRNSCLKARKVCAVVSVDDKAGSAATDHYSHAWSDAKRHVYFLVFFCFWFLVFGFGFGVLVFGFGLTSLNLTTLYT
jgi:hypothetical protein